MNTNVDSYQSVGNGYSVLCPEALRMWVIITGGQS